MRLDDWRNLPDTALAPIYERERARWANGLQWDLAPSLRAIEAARREGTLAGLVIRGPGHSVVGWSYFLVHNGMLQVGALHARTADGVRLLLDAIFKTPEASLAQELLLFVYPDSPACESALQRRRFDVTRYWYLRRTLDRQSAAAGDDTVRALRDSDGPDLVRLFARAYAGVPGARCFAPHGRLDEWAQYLGQLTRGTALGRFQAGASSVVDGPAHSPLAAASLVTALSDCTIHLAQLVVDPRARRQRLATRLLDRALAWGATNGRAVATLLVSEQNAHARALYDSRGFVQTGYFLHASRPLGRRVLSPAAAASA
ncbi:MAG: GNAT family N-acetyltransferase [Acidobacteria bacterium]|nr:GNAT family N-acetyltransferase [Acidobacteriota bacterium]